MEDLENLLKDTEKIGSIKFLMNIEELGLTFEKVLNAMKKSSHIFLNVLVELIYSYDLDLNDFLFNNENGDKKHLANISEKYAYILCLLYTNEKVKDLDIQYNLGIDYGMDYSIDEEVLNILKVIDIYKNYERCRLYKNSQPNKDNFHRIPQLVNMLLEEGPFTYALLNEMDIVNYDIYMNDSNIYLIFERVKMLKSEYPIYYKYCKNKYMEIVKNLSRQNKNNYNIYVEEMNILGELPQ